jgi:hypothetical protein
MIEVSIVYIYKLMNFYNFMPTMCEGMKGPKCPLLLPFTLNKGFQKLQVCTILNCAIAMGWLALDFHHSNILHPLPFQISYTFSTCEKITNVF